VALKAWHTRPRASSAAAAFSANRLTCYRIDKLPVDARARLTWMWTQPQFFRALGSQIDSMCTSAQELMSAGEVLGELPLAVVSATSPHPHHVMMQERLVAHRHAAVGSWP
jgi:hypothetical protein